MNNDKILFGYGIVLAAKIDYNNVNDNITGRKHMVTLKDIAQKAGVSSMTVSRVMNGNIKDVSQKTSQRIQKIAKEMGYVPNSSARALASHSSRMIAAILLDYDEESTPLEDAYNSSFFGELSRQIQKDDYDLMLHYVKDYTDINYSLKTWNVAGAVFIGMFDENIKKIQKDHAIPLIFTDSYSSVRSITNVGIDDYQGGETAARHLLEKGHRNLAFVGPAAVSNGVIMHRLQGFCSFLRHKGISMPPEHIIDTGTGQISQALLKLCSGDFPVTGIFATSDFCASLIYAAAYEMGLRIPEDLSVIGFDDLRMSRYMTPPLTTVRQDVRRKAGMAWELLKKNIKTPDAPAENVVLRVALTERGSVRNLRSDRLSKIT